MLAGFLEERVTFFLTLEESGFLGALRRVVFVQVDRLFPDLHGPGNGPERRLDLWGQPGPGVDEQHQPQDRNEKNLPELAQLRPHLVAGSDSEQRRQPAKAEDVEVEGRTIDRSEEFLPPRFLRRGGIKVTGHGRVYNAHSDFSRVCRLFLRNGRRLPFKHLVALDDLFALQPDRELVDIGVRLAAVEGDAVDELRLRSAVPVGGPGEVLFLTFPSPTSIFAAFR